MSIVSEVVDTCLQAKWTFVPALALDELYSRTEVECRWFI